tara:strand:+ start:13158 stop:13862 length:705 start_codon:yes stop_codon:yes gene_type:complete
MTQFNLKKKKSREKFFFDKNNIISEIGNELIFDKVSFIKKVLEQVLVIDNYELKDHPKILDYQYSEFEDIGEKNSFDGILSNFKVHIPLIQNMSENLNTIKQHLNNDGFFCFNLITNNSMVTIRKLFNEIDEFVFKGAYTRFGPFHEVPNVIDALNKNGFKDIVVSTEFIELNYRKLSKLRSDFKQFGLINIYDQNQIFKRDFLKKTELLFSKIIQQHESIPIELEIATFTSWK